MEDQKLSQILEEIVLLIQLEVFTPRQLASFYPTFFRRDGQLEIPLLCTEILEMDKKTHCENIEIEMKKGLSQYSIRYKKVEVEYQRVDYVNKLEYLKDFPTTGIRHLFIVHILV
jgi:hypothetical protein